MTKNKITNIVGKIVEMLTPLASEERQRVVSASMTLLGESTDGPNKNAVSEDKGDKGESIGKLPTQAQTWMRQNSLSLREIEQVFHIDEGTAEVIPAGIPGKDKKEKTYNAYVLTGIARLLATGDRRFGDKTARELCNTSGFYDSANHAAYLKKKGNEFTGNKTKGWVLTAPGLERGAELIKKMNDKKK